MMLDLQLIENTRAHIVALDCLKPARSKRVLHVQTRTNTARKIMLTRPILDS